MLNKKTKFCQDELGSNSTALSEYSTSVASNIYDFMVFSEKLKTELRHSWLSSGRRESVAEHTWQMAILALLVSPNLENSIDINKALKMVIVHDITECIVGDIPYTTQNDKVKKLKAIQERNAIDDIQKRLNNQVGDELKELWLEFEEGETQEAKFVKSLDNLEVQIQHNIAPMETWEPVEIGLLFTKMNKSCSCDKFLNTLRQVVIDRGVKKLEQNNIEYSQFL